MKWLDMFLILLSAGTIISVVVALKTPFFITDRRERTHQAIHFLLGIIVGYIFASFLGGVVLGILKELGEITLAAHRRLLSPERMLHAIRAIMFWVLGGFLGSHALEKLHYSMLFIVGT